MFNRFCKKPLWEVTRELTDTAMGRRPADLVITNAKLVNVCTAEIQDGIDVAIAEGRIALVGDAAHCIGEGTKVIDAKGAYIAPGFIDGHIHVESSMITVGRYSDAVIPHGTTAIFMDPHEICNVCGLDGVKFMIEDAQRVPLKAISNAPSCVPAVAGFEDTGSSIDADDIKEMMSWDGVMGLGELMNYPGVLSGDPSVHAEIAETLKADNIVTGHYSVPDVDCGLSAYIAAGVRCCHESVRPEDIIEKMRRGMYVFLRYGSAWQDMPVIISAVMNHEIDDRYACMCSDDLHSDTLIGKGHIDYIIREAVKLGLDPIKAIQFVTINAATCFRMDHELGSIAPGKCADIVFFDDLNDIRITRTVIDGEVIFENGQMLKCAEQSVIKEEVLHTMNVGEEISAGSFRIEAPVENGTVGIRAIEIVPDHVSNKEYLADIKAENGAVNSDTEKDLLKMFVFERHHASGTRGAGFVKGFGIKRGAMAQTVAHDAHNLLVVGTNDEDMALAANTLIECDGGLCVAADGKVLAVVPLPIAGLMNDLPAEEMAELVGKLDQAWKDMGCTINSPYMTMALIPLACIPELRLTNRGLVDCRTYEFVNLFTDR